MATKVLVRMLPDVAVSDSDTGGGGRGAKLRFNLSRSEAIRLGLAYCLHVCSGIAVDSEDVESHPLAVRASCGGRTASSVATAILNSFSESNADELIRLYLQAIAKVVTSSTCSRLLSSPPSPALVDL